MIPKLLPHEIICTYIYNCTIADNLNDGHGMKCQVMGKIDRNFVSTND